MLLPRGMIRTLDVNAQVPAAYTGLVLTVASTTATDGTSAVQHPIKRTTASYFTSDGLGVTISAPGEEWEDIFGRGPNCYLQSMGILSRSWVVEQRECTGRAWQRPTSPASWRACCKPQPDRTRFDGFKAYFNSSVGADLMAPCRSIQGQPAIPSTSTARASPSSAEGELGGTDPFLGMKPLITNH